MIFSYFNSCRFLIFIWLSICVVMSSAHAEDVNSILTEAYNRGYEAGYSAGASANGGGGGTKGDVLSGQQQSRPNYGSTTGQENPLLSQWATQIEGIYSERQMNLESETLKATPRNYIDQHQIQKQIDSLE